MFCFANNYISRAQLKDMKSADLKANWAIFLKKVLSDFDQKDGHSVSYICCRTASGKEALFVMKVDKRVVEDYEVMYQWVSGECKCAILCDVQRRTILASE